MMRGLSIQGTAIVGTLAAPLSMITICAADIAKVHMVANDIGAGSENTLGRA
jgi:hypothetical protein